MAKWVVTVTETTEYRKTVEADSQEHAEELAGNSYSMSDADPSFAGFELVSDVRDERAVLSEPELPLGPIVGHMVLGPSGFTFRPVPVPQEPGGDVDGRCSLCGFAVESGTVCGTCKADA